MNNNSTITVHDDNAADNAASAVDEQQQQSTTTTDNNEDQYPLSSFCGSCNWHTMGFNCNARVTYLVNTYHLEEEHAIRDTLAKGECVSPDYVRPPKKEDVGEVKEDEEEEEEKVDETNAASVAEVVPLSTTNHETEEEKTSTKCISTQPFAC